MQAFGTLDNAPKGGGGWKLISASESAPKGGGGWKPLAHRIMHQKAVVVEFSASDNAPKGGGGWLSLSGSFPEADDCGTTVADDDGPDDSWYYHDMVRKNFHVSKD